MWLGKQAKVKKKEKVLNQKQIGLLDSIEFTWKIWRINVAWKDRFEEVKLFKATYGHCRVTGADNKELSNWVSYQRYECRLFRDGKKSKINEHKIQLLDGIEFDWTINVTWEDRFEEVKQFKATNGHCRVTGAANKEL